jgi:hypothetical protein
MDVGKPVTLFHQEINQEEELMTAQLMDIGNGKEAAGGLIISRAQNSLTNLVEQLQLELH